MKKFEVELPIWAYKQYAKNHEKLFGIGGGHDIRILKNGQNGSYCDQHSFNYNGLTGSLCSPCKVSQQLFTPKRFIVIQMK